VSQRSRRPVGNRLIRAIKEGDDLRVGSVKLRFLETPGHTPEGVSVLVFEKLLKLSDDVLVSATEQ